MISSALSVTNNLLTSALVILFLFLTSSCTFLNDNKKTGITVGVVEAYRPLICDRPTAKQYLQNELLYIGEVIDVSNKQLQVLVPLRPAPPAFRKEKENEGGKKVVVGEKIAEVTFWDYPHIGSRRLATSLSEPFHAMCQDGFTFFDPTYAMYYRFVALDLAREVQLSLGVLEGVCDLQPPHRYMMDTESHHRKDKKKDEEEAIHLLALCLCKEPHENCPVDKGCRSEIHNRFARTYNEMYTDDDEKDHVSTSGEFCVVDCTKFSVSSSSSANLNKRNMCHALSPYCTWRTTSQSCEKPECFELNNKSSCYKANLNCWWDEGNGHHHCRRLPSCCHDFNGFQYAGRCHDWQRCHHTPCQELSDSEAACMDRAPSCQWQVGDHNTNEDDEGGVGESEVEQHLTKKNNDKSLEQEEGFETPYSSRNHPSSCEESLCHPHHHGEQECSLLQHCRYHIVSKGQSVDDDPHGKCLLKPCQEFKADTCPQPLCVLVPPLTLNDNDEKDAVSEKSKNWVCRFPNCSALPTRGHCDEHAGKCVWVAQEGRCRDVCEVSCQSHTELCRGVTSSAGCEPRPCHELHSEETCLSFPNRCRWHYNHENDVIVNFIDDENEKVTTQESRKRKKPRCTNVACELSDGAVCPSPRCQMFQGKCKDAPCGARTNFEDCVDNSQMISDLNWIFWSREFGFQGTASLSGSGCIWTEEGKAGRCREKGIPSCHQYAVLEHAEAGMGYYRGARRKDLRQLCPFPICTLKESILQRIPQQHGEELEMPPAVKWSFCAPASCESVKDRADCQKLGTWRCQWHAKEEICTSICTSKENFDVSDLSQQSEGEEEEERQALCVARSTGNADAQCAWIHHQCMDAPCHLLPSGKQCRVRPHCHWEPSLKSKRMAQIKEEQELESCRDENRKASSNTISADDDDDDEKKDDTDGVCQRLKCEQLSALECGQRSNCQISIISISGNDDEDLKRKRMKKDEEESKEKEGEVDAGKQNHHHHYYYSNFESRCYTKNHWQLKCEHVTSSVADCMDLYPRCQFDARRRTCFRPPCHSANNASNICIDMNDCEYNYSMHRCVPTPQFAKEEHHHVVGSDVETDRELHGPFLEEEIVLHEDEKVDSEGGGNEQRHEEL